MADISPIVTGFVSPVLTAMGVLATLLCVFFLVWGGLGYITSSGDPRKLARAKRMLVRSLIGLTIVLAALAISLILNHTFFTSAPVRAVSLPNLGSVEPVSDGGGLTGVLIKAIAGLLVDIIKAAGKPFILALSDFTKATPLLTHNSSVVHLWVICAGIADGLLALVIALIGFHVMGAEVFGLRDVSLPALLPQLLLAFVLINSSIYVLDGLIELSNVMISALRAGMGNITPWQSLLNIVSQASAYSIAALIIFGVFLAFAVILLIYYIGRIVVLYLGAVLSPLVILLWLIPGFKDFAENALKAYMATVFVLFIHVIILSLAGSLFEGVASGSDPIMSLLLGMATLTALLKTQGVLMQLNYASIGPRTARRLGGSFVNGISYLAISTRYAYSGVVAPAINVAGESVRSVLPASKPKVYRPQEKDSPRKSKQ